MRERAYNCGNVGDALDRDLLDLTNLRNIWARPVTSLTTAHINNAINLQGQHHQRGTIVKDKTMTEP